MLQPTMTSGIKIKTTLDTSTPAITAAISPIPATMAATPKTFSPVRRTDLGYPRTTQLRGRLPAVRLPQHPDEHHSKRPSSSESRQRSAWGGGPALPPIPACKTCPARRHFDISDQLHVRDYPRLRTGLPSHAASGQGGPHLLWGRL